MEDRLELHVGLCDEVQRITTTANEDMIQKYNMRLRPKNFQVGDVVLMKTRTTRKKGQKLMPTWVSLGIITWVGNRGGAKVETPKGGTKTYNLDSLKHYFGPIEKID